MSQAPITPCVLAFGTYRLAAGRRKTEVMHMFALCWQENREELLSSLSKGMLYSTALTLCIHPFRVQIWERCLITQLLDRLRWLVIDDTAGSPLPVCPVDTHCALIGGRRDVEVAVENDGRQFGGGYGIETGACGLAFGQSAIVRA